MQKKTLTLAALMAVAGKSVAQNEAILDYDIKSLNERFAALAENNRLQDSLKQAMHKNILEYEDIYRQMQLGWDIKMLKGGDEARAIKPQIKAISLEMIDNRVGLMLNYCPELKVAEVEGFVNTLLNKANALNKFRFGTKLPANAWDVDSDTRWQMLSKRNDLADLVQKTYILNKDNLQEDFLSPQFLKKLDKKYNQARAASIKNPNDEEKRLLLHHLLSDIGAINRLQKGIVEAKKQGIQFSVEDLKQAVIANSQAESLKDDGYINGYDKDNREKMHIVIESKNKIVDAVKNMYLADVAPQTYSYNRETAENTATDTLSWDMAKAIAGQSHQK